MRYFLRRFAFFVATLWAAVTLNFLIPRLQPGDPAQAMATRLAGQNKQVTPEQLHALQLMIGAPTGNILQQYGDYLDNLVHGRFGISYSSFPTPVIDLIVQKLPWTLVLVGVTQVIAFVAGSILGAFAAWKRNTRFDTVVSLGSTFVGTLPFFWIALLLLYVFAFTLQWLPDSGGYGDGFTPGLNADFLASAAYHSVLPAIAILVTAPIGWIMGMRNTMVQTLGEDYIRLARAKGLTQRRIALRYGARNAILPNVTGFAIALGSVLGGQVLIEQIFGYPGLGNLMFGALGDKDYPLIQALFLFTTMAVLVANLVADLTYGVLDPRVRRGATS
jgi:ABC-type dipeptide/oligopeptide/nickel transport system permease component